MGPQKNTGLEPGNVKILSYEQLRSYTDNFSERNCIGHFQFGKFYHGKIEYSGSSIVHYLVKMWEIPENCIYNPGDNDLRLMDELILFRHERFISHPGILKITNYCCEKGHLGIVWMFKPLDSVFNLIPKESFTWLQRIKVALGLASLLRHLHVGKSSFYKPILVHNLDAAHVMVDEEYNPKLCDFGSITGGIFCNKRTYSTHDVFGCSGCIDIAAFGTDPWSNKQDVFAFGIIVLSLISKRSYTEEDKQAGSPYVFEWALTKYESDNAKKKNTEFSLVDESLAVEHEFWCAADGHKITMLALKCVDGVEHERPTIKQVLGSLLKLEVVKQYSDFLGVEKLLQSQKNGH